uniref:Uncharacterized protein n=1 Tax=Coccidioides posadasii RMSCC 3488 TaxID=454284 RepID=A0A0J6FJP5_COCPO|nr:hypothetical protein CPAG_06864 [Coccidioides posadasii RMSCC 3488]
MEWVGSALRKWAGSCFPCVLPENERRTPIHREQRPGVERVVPIYNNQQPKAIPPMKLVIYGDLPSPNEPHPPFLNISKWKTEGRDLASKLNKRKGLLSRVVSTNEQKRRMISAPTDFRRVPTQVNRRLSFRPLELSIYLPGNRLPDLPEFCDFDLDGPRVPPKAIWSPSFNSHHRRYSDTPSTFSVPRKPVRSLRDRSSLIGDQDSYMGHRSTLSDSRLSQSMSSPSINRFNNKRIALHNRSQSSPVASPTSPIGSNINEETPPLVGGNLLYSPVANSSAPSSPLSDFAMSTVPKTPPTRSDSFAHWLMNSPSSPNSVQQTLPKHSSSYTKRCRQISNSTVSTATSFTAASRRTHSLASSMTSAGTLYQSTPVRDVSDKTYELPLDNVSRGKLDYPRYEEVYPTIYESGQYRFTPTMPDSPRTFGTADIGLAF